jgi:hypothetical protein
LHPWLTSLKHLKLQSDAVTPFSLGALRTLSNLRSLDLYYVNAFHDESAVRSFFGAVPEGLDRLMFTSCGCSGRAFLDLCTQRLPNLRELLLRNESLGVPLKEGLMSSATAFRCCASWIWWAELHMKSLRWNGYICDTSN